jgi:DNA end-binding protein Ku
MWKGVISFGMVSIPIRLYVATERSSTVSFRQLCPEHMAPIKYKRWCPAGDHEVTYSEVLKGFEVGSDSYVVIEDEDLENLPLPTARTIEIQEFVPAGDINGGLYFDAAYYVEPEEAGRKAYQLLKRALEETGRTAVAKIALRDREHLCALQPTDGMVLMNVLHWPDEIRPATDLKGLDGEVKVGDRELKMAVSLVESLADDFDPSRYADNYREALMKIVEAKVEGQETVVAPEVEEAPRVMDLMDALKASVEAAKSKKASKGREAEREEPARKPARQAARRKAS